MQAQVHGCGKKESQHPSPESFAGMWRHKRGTQRKVGEQVSSYAIALRSGLGWRTEEAAPFTDKWDEPEKGPVGRLFQEEQK